MAPSEDSDRRSRRNSPTERGRERDRGNGRGNDRDRERTRRRSRERRRSRTPESSRQSRGRDRHRSRERHGRSDRDRGRDRDRDRRHRSRDRRDDNGKDTSVVKNRGPLPSQEASFALTKPEGEQEKPKEKPSLANSGFLAAASNSVTQADGSTITLKYHEPPEARKASPRDQWKLFVFKGPDIVDTIELSTRSCWLVGRESAVVDLPVDHPSISKQHAVIQFRYTEKRNEYGDKIGKVKPYLIDLESANGTILNDSKIPDSRYLELRDKDMIQLGQSTREYVVMLAPRE